MLGMSWANGSSSVARGLPVGSAYGDSALSIGAGELITTLSRFVEGTVQGTLAIVGMPALGVGDTTHMRFAAATSRRPN